MLLVRFCPFCPDTAPVAPDRDPGIATPELLIPRKNAKMKIGSLPKRGPYFFGHLNDPFMSDFKLRQELRR